MEKTDLSHTEKINTSFVRPGLRINWIPAWKIMYRIIDNLPRIWKHDNKIFTLLSVKITSKEISKYKTVGEKNIILTRYQNQKQVILSFFLLFYLIFELFYLFLVFFPINYQSLNAWNFQCIMSSFHASDFWCKF